MNGKDQTWIQVITIDGTPTRIRIMRPNQPVEDIEISHIEALNLASDLMSSIPFHKAKFDAKI